MALAEADMNAECPVYASIAYKITHTQLRSREPNSLYCSGCKLLWPEPVVVKEPADFNVIITPGLTLCNNYITGVNKNKMPCVRRRITVTNPVRAVTTEYTIMGPYAHQTSVMIETWVDCEMSSAEPGNR